MSPTPSGFPARSPSTTSGKSRRKRASSNCRAAPAKDSPPGTNISPRSRRNVNALLAMPTLVPLTDVLIRVRGIVQGVGFRPFVHRTANQLGLRGWVRNDSQGVLLRAVGDPADIDRLVVALREQPPTAARV